ncbi:GNAT family N-acetyltransferase [Pectobacteriaceae bacterium CE70]|nr:GNAT family N-acetyltransferase [Pectobacteriaceae bacterium C52]WJV68021.1 GNAT family N-acetyltransferase [Pectobacteriaceae bacterium CE70]WJY11963.1 GNAT family N-acetyltransferase [Pectobacteriaceae bacterium C80]
METIRLSHIDTERDCLACFVVAQELRPHLISKDVFAEQVSRQIRQGYRMLAAWQEGQVVAFAGYRLLENLLYGRFIYVDDLAAMAEVRSHGIGRQIIEELRQTAQRLACTHLVLDTGLANVLAQRFYFRQGLLAKGLHFSLPV